MKRVKMNHEDSDQVIEVDESQVLNAKYRGWKVIEPAPDSGKSSNTVKSKRGKKDGKS